MDANARALLEELERRRVLKEGVDAKVRAIKAELFKEQLAFVEDPSTTKLAICSRRAGKTSMWARYSVIEALTHARVLIRLWANSRLRAKELLLTEIMYLCKRHGIQNEQNDTELTFTFANGSIIRLVGGNQDKDIQKKRGDKTRLEVVLESQNMGPLLKPLVEDVIGPSLMDVNGTVALEGTPGPVTAGYWFEASGGSNGRSRWVSDSKIAHGWSCHYWTLLNNPWLPHARAYLNKLKDERRWTDDSPTYLREWCGKWCTDTNALFYSFDTLLNTYDAGEVKPYGPGWCHSLGWDLGFRDDMAITIVGWHPQSDSVYEVFSWKKPGVTDAGEIMDVIADVETRLGLNLIAQVADTGGGGRMYVEQVQQRYGRFFKPAQKTQKYEHVRLINEMLTSGRLKLIPNSNWATEMAALLKDDPDPEKPEAPPKENPANPQHCCDAGLYGIREAFPHLAALQPKKAAAAGTADWAAGIEAAMAAKYKKGNDWTQRLEQGMDYGYGADS